MNLAMTSLKIETCIKENSDQVGHSLSSFSPYLLVTDYLKISVIYNIMEGDNNVQITQLSDGEYHSQPDASSS